MVAIYDVLKASKGIHVDDTFAELWGRKLSNAYTVATYIGALPATLQTVEGYLESYKIYGNTVQDGTPTPENPIVPSGCGELETTGAHAGQYKLALTINGVEHPIYLGEAETTRRIKKLTLTGEEKWARATNGTFYGYFVTDYYNLEGHITVCSHYIGDTNRSSTASVNDKACCFRISGTKTIYIRDTSFNSAIEFMGYLAAQYAAGTPVTVWYVLAEPETGIVNEPLMKIDDYADTIDSTQANVQIPTAAGTTIIDYNGDPKPDKVELAYRKPKGQ